MAKFTVIISTFHYLEADDMLDAATQVRDSLPEGAGVQNMQVVPGHQQFSNDH